MTGRHVAPEGGPPRAARRAPGPAVLAWRGLLAGRAPAVVLAVLAAITVAYLVATPRVASRAEDTAIGDAFRAQPAQSREISLRSAPVVVGDRPVVGGAPRPGPTAPFDAVDAVAREVMGPEVRPLLGAATWAAQSDPVEVTRADGGTVATQGALAVVRVQSGLAERVTWVTGTAPGPSTRERTVPSLGGPHRTAVVPVALAAPTAREWGLEVGDELVLTPEAGDLTPLAVVLSGTFTPVDPVDGFWQVEPRMTGIAAIPTPQGGVIPQGALVAAAGSYGAVTDGMWRAPSGRPEWPESPVLGATWRYPFDGDRLVATDAAALRRVLVRLDTDARLGEVTGRPLQVTTGIGGILTGYESSVRSTRVVTSFATAGLTALAVLVLALAAVVAVARRQAEVRLVRARGGSLGQVLGHVVTGTALPTLPVAALAVLVTVVLLPGTRAMGTWVEVALVVLVPVVASTVAVGWRVHSLERDDSVEETVRGRRVVRAARRLVAELAVVAVAGLAVATVRSRGGEISAGRTDWYAALAPVLVATVGGLVVLRALPPSVGVAARWAARRRGLVGFLGLARAARTGAAATLPVLAVVVGAAVLALLASLSWTIADQREVAAYRSVGAEVRVDALRIDPEDTEALAARPGVHAVVPAYVDAGANLVSGNRAVPVVVIATDPQALARLLRGTPVAVPSPGGTGDGALPVLLGPGAPSGEGLELVVRGARVPLAGAEHAPGLVRLDSSREFPAVVLPLDRLRALVPAAQPNTAFLDADPAAAEALRTLPDPSTATPSGRVLGVDTVAAAEHRVAARSLPRLVVTTYLVGAVLAAALTLLAVLLLLTATRPERAALVIRLRTMGLPHGGERALAWTEVLPVVALSALAGAAVGALAPSLVEAAVDLAPFTGGAGHAPLAPAPLAAAGAGVFVIVLGALALVLDAAAARRGRLADHLRRGDTA